jgi:hypothetical protein
VSHPEKILGREEGQERDEGREDIGTSEEEGRKEGK